MQVYVLPSRRPIAAHSVLPVTPGPGPVVSGVNLMLPHSLSRLLRNMVNAAMAKPSATSVSNGKAENRSICLPLCNNNVVTQLVRRGRCDADQVAAQKQMRPLVISVATDEMGYLPVLRQSCARHGYRLDVLGMGETWQGFGWRMETAVRRALQEPPETLIVFADAYDVVMCDAAARLQRQYALCRRPFVVGVYRYVRPLAGSLARHEFGMKALPCGSRARSPYQIPCAGVWVTTAAHVQRHLAPQLPFAPSMDDQRFLIQLLRKHPSWFYVDCGKHLICSAFPESLVTLMQSAPPIADDDQLTFFGGALHHGRMSSFPIVLHGVGNTNLDPLLRAMGYDARHNLPETYVTQKINYHLREVLKSVWLNVEQTLLEQHGEDSAQYLYLLIVIATVLWITAIQSDCCALRGAAPARCVVA
jgi:hypothetical protein